MKTALAVMSGLALLAAAPVASQQQPERQTDAAALAATADDFRRHIAAVMERAPVPQANRGYLEIAQTEIAIALRELGAAGHALDDLAETRRRVSRAAHALSPAVVPEGPGLGVGALQAVDQMIAHLRAATATAPVPEDVELAATPALVAAQTARRSLRDAVALAPAVATAGSAEQAQQTAARMTRLVGAALSGIDLDGDGETSWNLGEGGLYHTHAYASMMALGSGVATLPPQTASQ